MSERDAKSELLALHRGIVRRLEREVRASIETTAELRRFESRYRASLRTFRRTVPLRAVLDAAARADVVYVGDYHTLRASQRFALEILRGICARGRRPSLAMEVAPITRQPAVDAYLRGRIAERALPGAIDYERTWGFPWEGYRRLLAFARDHGLPVLALNGDPPVARDRLRVREALAAMVVADAIGRDVPRPVVVLAGDLHVVRAHLPAAVDRALGTRGIRAARVIVHQNVDALYWRVAGRTAGGRPLALAVRPGEFCAITATPLAKLQSYINWILDRGEIEEDVPAADAVDRIVRTLARFLRVDPSRLRDYRVYTAHDPGLLRALLRGRRFTDAGRRAARRLILSGESAYIPEVRAIYLASLSVEHAAEEAAHYVHAELSGRAKPPRARRDAFYFHALREGLAFLGSKVIDHVRPCYDEEDFRALRRARAGPRRDGRALRAIARFVLEHLRFEERLLARGPVRPRFRNVYRQPRPIFDGVTHCLGYLLGDRIFRAHLAGAIPRREIRDLFHRSFAAPGEGEAAYVRLALRTRRAAG